MTDTSYRELAFLFRDPQRHPVLLLGAGASYRSGVPLADESVRQIARAAYARQVRGVDVEHTILTPSDWLPWLQCQQWFRGDSGDLSEIFPLAVEHLLQPPEFRRTFFMKMIRAQNGISAGYHALAHIIARRLCWTVLTTNFDSLTVDALREQRPVIPFIAEVNRTKDDIVAFSLYNRCQIVYLHGAVEFYRDKNLPDETYRLDDALVRRVRPLLNDSPLVVIGYRGAEQSIMGHLLEEGIEDSRHYSHGIYWCVRKHAPIHTNVQRLASRIGSAFKIVPIEGFDELMCDLDRELAEDAWQGSSEPYVPSDVQRSLEEKHFDYRTDPGLKVDDLDHDLVLATLAEYCRRLKQPEVSRQTYIPFMRELGLLRRDGNEDLPTIGCYLMFGKEVQKHFPYARVALTRESKQQTIFEGNLILQYRGLLDALSDAEINPVLRLKGERKATEQLAYPGRVLSELVVNMLVHRDYAIEDYARIDILRGERIAFWNPGGLMPRVLGHVRLDQQRRFLPVRYESEVRNQLIADVFYGLGSMDKAGTGLADVHDLMIEAGGKAECSVTEENNSVLVIAMQARQSAADRSSVARRISPTDVYITNLLPFAVLPRTVYTMPLRDRPLTQERMFEESDVPTDLPVFIRCSGIQISFADPSAFEHFCDRVGFLSCYEAWPWDAFAREFGDDVLIWLLHKHWEFTIRKRPLIVEPKRRRAYFKRVDEDGTTVVYDSRVRKQVSRGVVKQRSNGEHVFHENEAVHYRVVSVGGTWAIRLKPSYVFTQKDGFTPLAGFLQSRRATRRFKFDRNKNVDDDLTFWARYLADGQATINLGNVGVEDLLLDVDYCSMELPRFAREEAE